MSRFRTLEDSKGTPVAEAQATPSVDVPMVTIRRDELDALKGHVAEMADEREKIMAEIDRQVAELQESVEEMVKTNESLRNRCNTLQKKLVATERDLAAMKSIHNRDVEAAKSRRSSASVKW